MAWYPSIDAARGAVRPALRKLTWLLAAAAVQLTFTSGAWAIGPGFDCTAVLAPGARIVCANPDLSRTDLAMAQAYYALRQQVGETGWQPLKLEGIAAGNRTLQQCGVPSSGALPDDTSGMAVCMARDYERQRAVWISRLSGPAAEEAQRPVETHLALQRALQDAGFLPASAVIDGVYGTGTRGAILAWQRANNRPVTGFIGDADAAALMPAGAGNTAGLPLVGRGPSFGAAGGFGILTILSALWAVGRLVLRLRTKLRRPKQAAGATAGAASAARAASASMTPGNQSTRPAARVSLPWLAALRAGRSGYALNLLAVLSIVACTSSLAAFIVLSLVTWVFSHGYLPALLPSALPGVQRLALHVCTRSLAASLALLVVIGGQRQWSVTTALGTALAPLGPLNVGNLLCGLFIALWNIEDTLTWIGWGMVLWGGGVWAWRVVTGMLAQADSLKPPPAEQPIEGPWNAGYEDPDEAAQRMGART